MITRENWGGEMSQQMIRLGQSLRERREQLGLSQRQITLIIRAIDSEEDGAITPIAFETVLRRVRWGQQALCQKSPQPYKSPRGANAKPVVNTFKTNMKHIASEQKIDELFDHQAQKTIKVLDSELALRDNLFRVIVKRVRVYMHRCNESMLIISCV